MSTPYFNGEGPVISIAATTTAPTAVQISSTSGVPCPNMLVQNLSTVNATVGWGATTIQAAQAVASTSSPNQYLIPSSQQAIIVTPPDGFFTALTTTLSAVIVLQPGLAR